MNNVIKKITVTIVLIAVIVNCFTCGGFAATSSSGVTVNEAKIRVLQENADISVVLTGDPGAHVAVAMFEPGMSLPEYDLDYERLVSGIAYVETGDLDESGNYTFDYKAEKIGFYTVRVNGAEIQYTTTHNDAPKVNPDRLYVEAWDSNGDTLGGFADEDFSYKVSINKNDIEAYGAEFVARGIKEKLMKKPEGRRTIFLDYTFNPRRYTSDRVWWDEGVDVVSKVVDSFFKAYYDIGGEVDYIHSDFEAMTSNWTLEGLGKEGRAEALEIIASSPRYPELKADMIKRGYQTEMDNGVELSSIFTIAAPRNYLYFNAAVDAITSDAIRRAVYEPAKKYFANIEYSEYQSSTLKFWEGYCDGWHKAYLAGNDNAAGTLSCPVLYSAYTRYFKYGNDFGVPDKLESSSVTPSAVQETDMGELLGTIGRLRQAANSTEEGAFAPYIATTDVPIGNYKNGYENEEYRDESFLHIGLHNPERLLYFRQTRGTDTEAQATQEVENLMEAIHELNDLIAYPDRHSLNTEQIDLQANFALSGIYANGRNLWRITPDIGVVSRESFLKSQNNDEIVFEIGTSEIVFPQGEIVETVNPSAELGYWVETPKGITPVINYDESVKTEEFAAEINFFDCDGYVTDPSLAESFDAVVSFKGYYGDKLKFIQAKYDENGILIDADFKECGVFDSKGNSAFMNVKRELDVDNIGFYVWESDSLKPILFEDIK